MQRLTFEGAANQSLGKRRTLRTTGKAEPGTMDIAKGKVEKRIINREENKLPQLKTDITTEDAPKEYVLEFMASEAVLKTILIILALFSTFKVINTFKVFLLTPILLLLVLLNYEDIRDFPTGGVIGNDGDSLVLILTSTQDHLIA